MNRLVIVFASLASLACQSQTPLENAKASVAAAFQAQEKGRIGFTDIQVEGDNCVVVEKDKEADCVVQSVKLKLGQDTNFIEENGTVKYIVAGIIKDQSTVKEGSTVELTGNFKLRMGTVGLGFKSWRLADIKLKKK